MNSLKFNSVSLPGNKADFFSMIETISFATTQEEKNILKGAKTFFCQNLEIFTPDEVKSIVSHQYFKKGYDGKFHAKAFAFSFKHHVPFPLLFGQAIKDLKEYDQLKYFEILNAHNCREQLDYFIDNRPKLVNMTFQNTTPCPYLFSQWVHKHPEYILTNIHWSNSEVDKFFKAHTEFMPQICKKYLAVRDKIYKEMHDIYLDHMSDYLINKVYANDKPDEQLVSSMSVSPKLWSILEAKKPEFIKGHLERQYTHTSYVDSEKHSCNLAQSIVSSILQHQDTAQLLKLLEPYMHLGLMPIEEDLNGYKRKSDPFEFALRYKDWQIFLPYAYRMHLITPEQQEMMVAAAFTYMHKKDSKKHYMSWVKVTLLESPAELIDKYYQINLGKISEIDFLNDVEKIISAKRLEASLPQKEVSLNRKKI